VPCCVGLIEVQPTRVKAAATAAVIRIRFMSVALSCRS
jgi:hypothetical protein